MTTKDRENVFAIVALPALALAAVLGFMCWHASRTDAHFRCVMAHKAEGMTTRAAHNLCVSQGIAH